MDRDGSRADGRIGIRYLLICLTAIVAGTIALYLVAEPNWNTNDDVAISMTAHGYGFAAYGSPYLIFSSRVWGEIVRVIPENRFLLGYTIAMLVTLVASLTAITVSLRSLGAPTFLAAGVVAVIGTVALLNPQFTILSALAMIAAVVCALARLKGGSLWFLIAAGAFALVSYMVRDSMFFLMGLLAVPLVLWAGAFRSRENWVSLAVVGALALGVHVIDVASFAGPEWDAHKALNEARLPFNDTTRSAYLAQQPDALESAGMSSLDLLLVMRWFYFDPAVADPVKLNAALAAVTIPDLNVRLPEAFTELHGVIDNGIMYPLLLMALVLTLLFPSWKTLFYWVYVIAIAIGISLEWRTIPLRLAFPMTVFLSLMPLLFASLAAGFSRRRTVLATGFVGIIAFVSISVQMQDAWDRSAANAPLREEFALIPSDTIAVVGAGLDYQAIYPFLMRPADIPQTTLLASNASTLHVAFNEPLRRQTGNDFRSLFTSRDGLYVYMLTRRYPLLAEYCRQYHSGRLVSRMVPPRYTGNIRWVRCEATPR